mmetsp:Transcript_49969/g.99507  ORF Transcript_49969/g.99507 Transcript_49969/m.99507 type:complete len:121 (+) Transcript_49969:268-630(+)
MQYKDVSIESVDGIRLSAWEIVQPGNKLAIINHPLTCTRYGCVKGLDGVPVEFLPMVKALFDAGVSIITYGQRGQGETADLRRFAWAQSNALLVSRRSSGRTSSGPSHMLRRTRRWVRAR